MTAEHFVVGCASSDKESVRCEIRDFLSMLKTRHAGAPKSISAALANVNPYTLFDSALIKKSADLSPALASDL